MECYGACNGAWSNSNNWTTAAWPVGDGGPGYISSGTVIDNGGTATIAAGDNVTDNTSVGTGYFYIGGTNTGVSTIGGNGAVNMTGGTLQSLQGITQQEFLGFGGAGVGVFTQSGGVNIPYVKPSSDFVYSKLSLGSSANGSAAAGVGVYNMSGGSVGANAMFVGQVGSGTFAQSGGSIGVIGTGGANLPVGLYVGGDIEANLTHGTGSYTLGNTNGTSSNALLVGGVEYVGVRGSGVFNQTGGTNAIIGGGSIGQYGSVNAPDTFDGALVLGQCAAKTSGAKRARRHRNLQPQRRLLRRQSDGR